MISQIQYYSDTSAYTTKHSDYIRRIRDWVRIRDCIEGESAIKGKQETYLPRPPGMSGEYSDAYAPYLDRAHFPQICAYALQGALGVIITKLPEFNVPSQLKYIISDATKDGSSIQQLFLDCIIEVLQTGRCVLVIDVTDDNKFKFVKYNAEAFINWKESAIKAKKSLIAAVLTEELPATEDILSYDTEKAYHVLHLDKNGCYAVESKDSSSNVIKSLMNPTFLGKKLKRIPLFVSGSINNSFDIQPVPLLSVANCSIQIYRKEADLANSEYISCNPTLCMVGVNNDENVPNVVGSSVMITVPDAQARIFYTETDTAALTHVKAHIADLYDEAIRHGVAILDTKKGSESAEALRIRQATQSASIYSVYLSVLNAMKSGLQLMCEWGGYNVESVEIDAPSALTYGIPDSAVIREVINGFGSGVVPISVIHRYLVGSGLLDQKVSIEEYVAELDDYVYLRDASNSANSNQAGPKNLDKSNSDSNIIEEMQGTQNE